MRKNPQIGIWFAAAAGIFFTRSFLYSTWVSRGPEVQSALHINTAEMGLLSMLYPAGGLAAVSFAGWLVHRYGSRAVNTAAYTLASAALAGLGFAVEAGNFLVSVVCLFFLGLPMALSDFIGNLEGSAVDKASKRSLFPAIHGLFGVGMLLGAQLASWLITQNVSLSISFVWVAIITGAIAIISGYALPKHNEPELSAAVKAENKAKTKKAWSEKRSLILAIIGFSFIMAEISSNVWVPIALTSTGFSGAEAASALGVLWIAITITRLLGGFAVDFIGRFRTVLFSAILAIIGMSIFMSTSFVHLPHLGLILWGLGMALGFPLTVSSMGDQPAMASARVNMIITVVYISSILVGPVLGAVGQAFGIYVGFGIPLALLVLTAILSPATKPLDSK